MCCLNTLWCVIFQWRMFDWLIQHCIYSSRKLCLLLPAANNYHSMSIYASRYDCVFHFPTHAEIWSYCVQIWGMLSQSLWIPIYSWPVMFRRQCSLVVTPTNDFLHIFSFPIFFSFYFQQNFYIIILFSLLTYSIPLLDKGSKMIFGVVTNLITREDQFKLLLHYWSLSLDHCRFLGISLVPCFFLTP